MEKGEFRGLCNRTACQKPGAVYYNHSTRKHYCRECAKLINDANRRDAMEMFGHELCTLVEGTDEDEIHEDVRKLVTFDNPHVLQALSIDPLWNNPKPLPGIPAQIRTEPKVYPNDPCKCGSGKKYKACCR